MTQESPDENLREESLFYELGYKFSPLKHSNEKPLQIDVTLYLLLISLFLHVFLNIRQTFTLIILGIIIFNKYFGNQSKTTDSSNLLIIALVANIIDHLLAGLLVQPGVLFSFRLTVIYWLTELFWALLFGMQVIIHRQPFTPLVTPGLTVHPETQKSQEILLSLEERLESTNYSLKQKQGSLGLEAIRSSLEYLVLVVITVLVVSLMLDIFIWRVVGSLGGGVNVLEEYFLSGLVLIFFISLFTFSDVIASSKETTENSPDAS